MPGPAAIAEGAGALIGTIGAGISARKDRQSREEQLERQLEYQRERDQHQEALMREGWERDDSQYQRRVADLREAGLSPLHGMDVRPETSPVSEMHGQSEDQPDGVDFRLLLEGISQATGIGQTIADIRRTNAETAESFENARKAGAEADVAENLSREDSIRHKHQMDYMEGEGDRFRDQLHASIRAELEAGRISNQQARAAASMVNEQIRQTKYDFAVAQRAGIRSTDNLDARAQYNKSFSEANMAKFDEETQKFSFIMDKVLGGLNTVSNFMPKK